MSDVRLRFIYIHLSLCAATISNGTIANGPQGNSFWQYAHKLLSIGISLSLAIIKGSLLCQISVKGCCHWFTDLSVLDGYVLSLLFWPPFLPTPSALIGYVIDARDLEFLNSLCEFLKFPLFQQPLLNGYIDSNTWNLYNYILLKMWRWLWHGKFQDVFFSFFSTITDGESTRAVGLFNKPKAFFSMVSTCKRFSKDSDNFTDRLSFVCWSLFSLQPQSSKSIVFCASVFFWKDFIGFTYFCRQLCDHWYKTSTGRERYWAAGAKRDSTLWFIIAFSISCSWWLTTPYHTYLTKCVLEISSFFE